MDSNEHKNEAEKWAGYAERNLNESQVRANAGMIEGLDVLVAAAHAQAAVAQVHATLAVLR